MELELYFIQHVFLKCCALSATTHIKNKSKGAECKTWSLTNEASRSLHTYVTKALVLAQWLLLLCHHPLCFNFLFATAVLLLFLMHSYHTSITCSNCQNSWLNLAAKLHTVCACMHTCVLACAYEAKKHDWSRLDLHKRLLISEYDDTLCKHIT